jgi:hypothetical protein
MVSGWVKRFSNSSGLPDQISGPSSPLFRWYSAFSPRVKQVDCEADCTHSGSAKVPLSAKLCGQFMLTISNP